MLRKHITYFHIKDKIVPGGPTVPSGKGNGQVKRILGEAFTDGFDSFLTLEPHLSLTEANYGKTTPALFGIATRALRSILDEIEQTQAGSASID